MRLLIRFFVLLIILALVFLSIWGGWTLEKIGTYILQTPVDINRVKFIPHRLVFKLYGVNLPEKDILMPLGNISLFPPRLQLHGLKIRDKTLLNEKGFLFEISRSKNWDISAMFKGVNLSRLGYGFQKGQVSGVVNGYYISGNCRFYGIVELRDVIYSSSNGGFLGISSSEFQEIIDTKNGNIELDFTYNGPIDGLMDLYRYKPGKKTFTLIKEYLLGKIALRVPKSREKL